MASRREIAITIKGNVSTSGGGGEISFSKGAASAVSGEQSAQQEIGKYTQGKSERTGVSKSVMAVYIANQIKNSIVQTATITWNRYTDMKEDYLAQNNMNQVKAYTSMAKSYATSAIAGAKMGAAFGPVGAVAGAAIGAIGNGVNRAINYKITMANYNEQNNAANAQTNFSRVRMGLIDGGRGTEN